MLNAKRIDILLVVSIIYQRRLDMKKPKGPRKSLLSHDVRSMIGKRIKMLREKANLRGKQLATASKLSSTQIYELEKGRKDPSLTILVQIALGLGIDISELTKGLINDHTKMRFRAIGMKKHPRIETATDIIESKYLLKELEKKYGKKSK